jgi:hypothetical protein
MVNHRALTAAVIDSRCRADTEVPAPTSARIAFTGGTDCNDHIRIWDALDKIRAKHPDMVLMHGGSPRGAERVAACSADNRKVAQVIFKPDWTRDGRASPRRQGQEVRHSRPALRRTEGREGRRIGAVSLVSGGCPAALRAARRPQAGVARALASATINRLDYR